MEQSTKKFGLKEKTKKGTQQRLLKRKNKLTGLVLLLLRQSNEERKPEREREDLHAYREACRRTGVGSNDACACIDRTSPEH
mmetsp:Transcript_43402/g.85645  ORF Transcript_43402/g.85645 Transcript_43402/m.85645 type:complete len:82 (+) Transcript_43402:3263-3508(+)